MAVCADEAAGHERVVWDEVNLEKSSELKPFSIRAGYRLCECLFSPPKSRMWDRELKTR